MSGLAFCSCRAQETPKTGENRLPEDTGRNDLWPGITFYLKIEFIILELAKIYFGFGLNIQDI